MSADISPNKLFNEISELIENTKSQVAQKVNASLVLLYWSIGNRVNTEILKDTPAEYGEKIIKQLSAQLNQKYGRSFNCIDSNLN